MFIGFKRVAEKRRFVEGEYEPLPGKWMSETKGKWEAIEHILADLFRERKLSKLTDETLTELSFQEARLFVCHLGSSKCCNGLFWTETVAIPWHGVQYTSDRLAEWNTEMSACVRFMIASLP